MPSFDIVSEVDKQEIDNALNQARKELVTRFDLKDAKTEIISEKDRIVLTADDAAHLRALREIVVGRLSSAASICETSSRQTLKSRLWVMPGRI
jgi:uncharacterized protein YajQ (UPF0234 family)